MSEIKGDFNPIPPSLQEKHDAAKKKVEAAISAVHKTNDEIKQFAAGASALPKPQKEESLLSKVISKLKGQSSS